MVEKLLFSFSSFFSMWSGIWELPSIPSTHLFSTVNGVFLFNSCFICWISISILES